MSYLGAEPTQQMPEVGTNTVETQDIKDGAVTAAKLAAGAAVPSQASQAGKYLTTDGTTASWGVLPSSLPVTTFSGSVSLVSVANGFLPVLQSNGSTTTNVTVS